VIINEVPMTPRFKVITIDCIFLGLWREVFEVHRLTTIWAAVV